MLTLTRKQAKMSGMKPQCPECKCETVYYRIKSKTFMCRRCGHEWAKETEKSK